MRVVIGGTSNLSIPQAGRQVVPGALPPINEHVGVAATNVTVLVSASTPHKDLETSSLLVEPFIVGDPFPLGVLQLKLKRLQNKRDELVDLTERYLRESG